MAGETATTQGYLGAFGSLITTGADAFKTIVTAKKAPATVSDTPTAPGGAVVAPNAGISKNTMMIAGAVVVVILVAVLARKK